MEKIKVDDHNRKTVSILFSDLVGFSKIDKEESFVKIKGLTDEFFRRCLNERNHFFKNTWGDAILICCFDPIDLLEIAFELKNYIITRNWKRLGFDDELKIRIGLHAETVNVLYEDGKVIEVMGKNVNAAARIEPIVEPNEIFCSELFYSLVKDENKGYVEFHSLGNMQLAKQFGRMKLYKIIKKNSITEMQAIENKSNSPDKIIPIKIKRKFSDIEKDKYLKEIFDYICNFFEDNLRIIRKQETEIETMFERIRPDKMISRIYFQGEARAECQIWIGRNFMNGINYSEKIDDHENSYNETLMVESDGYNLTIKTFGMMIGGSIRNDDLCKEDATQYLWDSYIKKLEY